MITKRKNQNIAGFVLPVEVQEQLRMIASMEERSMSATLRVMITNRAKALGLTQPEEVQAKSAQ